MNLPRQRFDPYALLAALERRRVAYVLIGGFARVIQGTDELTQGLDLAPSLRAENLSRLGLALTELEAERVDRRALALDESTIREQANSSSCPSLPAPAADTMTSAAPPRASRSARVSAPASPRSPTSPACSPPSAANKT